MGIKLSLSPPPALKTEVALIMQSTSLQVFLQFLKHREQMPKLTFHLLLKLKLGLIGNK